MSRVTRSAGKRNLSNASAEVLVSELETAKTNGADSKGRRESQEKAGTAAKPITAPRKRVRRDVSKLPSITPIPSKVQHEAGLHVSGDIDDVGPPPPARPAEPHITNAPLQTRKGSRVAIYSEQVLHSAPPRTGAPSPSTDTNKLLEDACSHLRRVEPKLGPLIDKHKCYVFSPEGLAETVDPFRSLVSGIMAQQVSGAATTAIKRRFMELFTPKEESNNNDGIALPTELKFPTPEQVVAVDHAFLRTAGLSGRKAEYIKGLAEKFASGELGADMLVNASYDEVLERLTAVRGLGKWSVEMFACFALKRMDVFSTGDLGVQRGMAAMMGRDVKKLKNKSSKWKYMAEQEMLSIAENFAPYRSLFMWYMWRIEDVDVGAIQDA